jgi:hypothetical protein
MPMGSEGADGDEGGSPESFRLQHSEGPGQGYDPGNDSPRERAPEPRAESAPQQVSAPPPPPPEARPSVVWSSSASAPDSGSRSDREE